VANSAQAKKRARQAEVHRQANAGKRSAMRTSVKRVKSLIEAADHDGAVQAFQEAEPVLDRMVGKGIIHKNMAARTKSRLSVKIKALK
jgi:small subunit ribosomal protein S20